MEKTILDACCGSRMFWFDKTNPNVLFADIRSENHILCDGRELNIEPDLIMDFRQMPFPENTFNLVVFDPPHLKHLDKSSWMAKKYGVLSSSWQSDLKSGFGECFRVLKPGGTLIFKWNENQIKVSEILKLIENKPLFGHRSGKQANTHWIAFNKIAKTVVCAPVDNDLDAEILDVLRACGLTLNLTSMIDKSSLSSDTLKKVESLLSKLENTNS